MVGGERRDKNGMLQGVTEGLVEKLLMTVKVQPGNIEVSSVAEKVANGEVWVLKGVVNYEL